MTFLNLGQQITAYPLLRVFLIWFIVLSLATIGLNQANAQPANDNCVNAINITTLDGSCSTYTTVNSTPDVANGACVEGNNNVWFTFTATSTTIDITVNNILRPEFTLVEFGTACNAGTATVITCQDQVGSYTSISQSGIAVTQGTEYTLIITTNGNTGGTFDLCITSASTLCAFPSSFLRN